MKESCVLDEHLDTIPTPAFVKVTYKKKGESQQHQQPKRDQHAAELAPSPSKKQEPKLVAPPTATAEAGTYAVAGEKFPTHVKALNGQAFASVEDFIAHLQSL